jgi:serine/threonine protein kinase
MPRIVKSACLLRSKVDVFNLNSGRIIAGKFEVLYKLGSGWEGEVYKIVESATGIECAAKLFYPDRNPRNRTAINYAKKLHDLRDCPIVIKYNTHEKITWHGMPVTVLISEYVEGLLLSEYLMGLRGKRLPPFQAAHLLYSLAAGLECIHYHGSYHGDLHTENVILSKIGLNYDLKFMDLYDPGGTKRDNIAYDICNAIRIFYDALGGQKHYAKQPVQIKEICCGLKRTLILNKFKTATALKQHLEVLEWD